MLLFPKIIRSQLGTFRVSLEEFGKIVADAKQNFTIRRKKLVSSTWTDATSSPP